MVLVFMLGLAAGLVVAAIACIWLTGEWSLGENVHTDTPEVRSQVTRVCDTHAPQCDCEACRVGY